MSNYVLFTVNKFSLALSNVLVHCVSCQLIIVSMFARFFRSVRFDNELLGIEWMDEASEYDKFRNFRNLSVGNPQNVSFFLRKKKEEKKTMPIFTFLLTKWHWHQLFHACQTLCNSISIEIIIKNNAPFTNIAILNWNKQLFNFTPRTIDSTNLIFIQFLRVAYFLESNQVDEKMAISKK